MGPDLDLYVFRSGMDSAATDPARSHMVARACSSYVSGAIAEVIRMPKPRHRAEPHCRCVA